MIDRCKVYVISVATSVERRARFAARAADTTMEWAFFDAHTGPSPNLVYDEAGALAHLGRPLRAGELGCYSSHYAVWGELLKSGDRQCVVLEDDVIADWRGIEAISKIDLLAAGFAYLRLYYKRAGTHRVVCENFARSTLCVIELFDAALGTQGYFITRRAAEIFCNRLNPIVHAVDYEMDRYFDHGVRNYSVFPFLVVEETGPSDIGEARYEAHVKTIESRRHLARDAAARRNAKVRLRLEKLLRRGA